MACTVETESLTLQINVVIIFTP